MNETDLRAIKDNPENYELRFYSTGSLMCTSNDIRMIKFDLEMKQHYRQENEKHELTMYLLKLERLTMNTSIRLLFFVLGLVAAIVLRVLLK